MGSSISRDSVVVATQNQVSSEFLDGETILLDIHGGVYYGLNPVAARIMSIIETPTPVAEIVEALLDEYEVEEDVCLRDVLHLLGELADRELIEIRDGAP